MSSYQCQSCSKTFCQEFSRGNHEYDRHSIGSEHGSFSCLSCSKPAFPFEYRLQQHQFSTGHTGQSTRNASSRQAGDFRDRLIKSSDIETFIQTELQPNESYRVECGEVLEGLRTYFRNNSSLEIGDFIKGGSFGKGTALKGKSDIDLVVVLNDVEGIVDHVKQLPSNIQILHEYLNLASRSNYGKWDLDLGRKSDYLVKFKIKRRTGSPVFDVDMLPTFPVSVETGDDREKLYREMIKNKNLREYYSAALVLVQKEFIKKQPANVKNLIRLVKYWRKTCFEETTPAAGNRRLPTSYPLELITVHVWEEARKLRTLNMAQLFRAVMQQLRDYRNLRVVWYLYYPRDLGENIFREEIRQGGPVVMDPANPTNNVCRAASTWSEVARVAGDTLNKPICSGVVH